MTSALVTRNVRHFGRIPALPIYQPRWPADTGSWPVR